MFRRIYLDNSATTPVDPAVVEAMLPYLMGKFGNASSIHFFGQEARAAVDKARHQVAALINARPNEIVFTSGGTEANNLAIRGLIERNADTPVRLSDRNADTLVRTPTRSADGSVRVPHIITSAIEHSAVLNVCEDLEKSGCDVTYLPVYENGVVKIEDVKAAIKENTVLISIMTANNEIGTLQPVAEIGRLIKDLRTGGKKIWFHTDAVQAAGKITVDVEEIGCDLLSISAHKLYAPKGIGALYVRRGIRLHPQNIGGHQERGSRGGTESVANIVAFGKACELAQDDLNGGMDRCRSPHEVRAPALQTQSDKSKAIIGKVNTDISENLPEVMSTSVSSTTSIDELRVLRDRFEQAVGETIPDVIFNGDREHRLPNISNISFRSVEGEGLLINLDMQGIAVSTGAACSSGSLEPSPVIRALGTLTPSSNGDEDRARSAIRFSLGRYNTSEDLDRVIEVLPEAVNMLRDLAPTRPGQNR